MKALYTAEATAFGGRKGHAETSDGVLKVELEMPKVMGGSGGAKTNPEQLFATGYAACFGSAIEFVARQQHVSLTDVEVHSKVHIGTTDTGAGFKLAVELMVKLPGIARAVGQKLIDTAHQVCPYSNATRGNIDVTITLAA